MSTGGRLQAPPQERSLHIKGKEPWPLVRREPLTANAASPGTQWRAAG